MDKRTGLSRIGWIVMALAAILVPAAGYAAPQTSEDAAPDDFSVTLQRSIEAGKKALSQALSTKAKVSAGEAVPVATVTTEIVGKAEGAKVPSKVSSEKKGKYVFEYPKSPVIGKEMEPVSKTIEGEVGNVIKMGMGVTFEQNKADASSRDLWIDFTQGIQLKGVKSFGEFQDGDKVRVRYVEAKDGSQRAIESIQLLKRKTQAEREKEAEENARFEAAFAKKEAAAAKSSMEGGS